MQTWTWADKAESPPAYRVGGEDVYELLRANRFDDAVDAVKTWRDDNPIRAMVAEGRFQDAICELGRVLFPRIGRTDWESPFRAYERALASAATGH